VSGLIGLRTVQSESVSEAEMYHVLLLHYLVVMEND